MSVVVLKDLGEIVTGDAENLTRVGDAILVEDGIIKEIGFFTSMNVPKDAEVVEANYVVLPGLIDFQLETSDGDKEAYFSSGILTVPTVSDVDNLPESVTVVETDKRIFPVGVWGGEFTHSVEDIEADKVDVIVGANGSPVSLPLNQVRKLIDIDKPLGLAANGNLKVATELVRAFKEQGRLDQLFLCSGSPYGRQLLNLWFFLSHLCWTAGLTGEQAITLVTGNVSKIFGLNTGIIDVGMKAEFVFISIPYGSEASEAIETLESGDIPSVVAVFKNMKYVPIEERYRIPTKQDEADELLKEIGTLLENQE